METFHLSNSDIDLACEEVGAFLSKAGVDRREALRIKLTLEEVLLEYQARFGEEVTFKTKLLKRLSAITESYIYTQLDKTFHTLEFYHTLIP